MNVSTYLIVVILYYCMFRRRNIIIRWIQNIVVLEYDHNKINTGVHTNFILSSWDISVGIATDYGLDGWGLIPGRGKKLFSTPQCPDRFWDPPRLLPNMYRGQFPTE
jgi:hypothetical protein